MPDYTNASYIPTVDPRLVGNVIDAVSTFEERSDQRVISRTRALDAARQEEAFMFAQQQMTDQFTTRDLPFYREAEKRLDFGKMAEGYSKLLSGYIGGNPNDQYSSIRAKHAAFVPQIGETINSIGNTMSSIPVVIEDAKGNVVYRKDENGKPIIGKDRKPVPMKLTLIEALQKAPFDYDVANTLMKHSSREGRIHLEQSWGSSAARPKFHFNEKTGELMNETDTKGWYTLQNKIAEKAGLTVLEAKERNMEEARRLQEVAQTEAIAKTHGVGVQQAAIMKQQATQRVQEQASKSLVLGEQQRQMEEVFLYGEGGDPAVVKKRDKNNFKALDKVVEMEKYLEANSPSYVRRARAEEASLRQVELNVEGQSEKIKLIKENREAVKIAAGLDEEWNNKLMSLAPEKKAIDFFEITDEEAAFANGMDINNVYIDNMNNKLNEMHNIFGVLDQKYLASIPRYEREAIVKKKDDIKNLKRLFNTMEKYKGRDVFGGTSDAYYNSLLSTKSTLSGKPGAWYEKLSEEGKTFFDNMEALRSQAGTAKTKQESENLNRTVSIEMRNFFKGKVALDEPIKLANIEALHEEYQKEKAKAQMKINTIQKDILSLSGTESIFNQPPARRVEHISSGSPTKRNATGVPSFTTIEEAEASGHKGEAIVDNKRAIVN